MPDEYWIGVDRSLAPLDQLSMALQTQSIGDRRFIDAILYDQPAAQDLEDGLQVQAVID